jgi:hypothetical protein
MRRTKRLKTSSVIFLTRSISFRLLLFLCSLQTNTTNIAALQKKTMPTGNCSPGLHIQQVPTTLVIHTTVPVILKNLMSICTPVHTQLYPGTNTVVPRYKHSCTPVQTQLYPGTKEEQSEMFYIFCLYRRGVVMSFLLLAQPRDETCL